MAVDPHTGLTWQRNDDVQRNWADADSYCGALDLDDHTDWRLPSAKELETIVLFACTNHPVHHYCVSTSAFPNTKRDGSYWTATDFHKDNANAWAISFNSGTGTGWMNKNSSGYTRCVRGDPLPQGPFVSDATTVGDQATGLMWEKSVSASAMTWASALSYCAAQTTGGYTDWRLPDVRELESLIDFSRDTPVLDPVFTVNAPGAYLWSGSPYGIDGYTDAYAFGIDLEYGTTNWLSGGNIYALCVRGGQVTPVSSYTPVSLLLLGGQ